MTRSLRTAAATLAAIVLLPAGAAHAADGKSVARALDRAGSLTDRAVTLAERGSDARASKAVRQARRAVTSASRDARRMALKARTTGRRLEAAGALALVAGRLGEDVEAYAKAVPATDGRAQTAVAGALPGTLSSHDAVIGALEGLVAKLPAAQRAQFEQLIAGLVAKWPAQLEALAAAASAEDLPTAVSGTVEQALGFATTGLREALARFDTVIATLPEPAQATIGQVLQTVQPMLDEILGVVDQVSKVLTTQLGAMLEMVREMVGGLVPVTGALDGAAGQDAPGDAGTDAGAGGKTPATGLGSFLDRIPVVGGLLGDLLGGLPILGGLLGGRA